MNLPESSASANAHAPASFSKTFGRLALVVALTTVFYACFFCFLPEQAAWTSRLIRVVPRMATLIFALLAAWMLRGARLSNAGLLVCGLVLLLAALAFQGWTAQFEILKAPPADFAGDKLAADSSWIDAGHVWFHVRPASRISGLVLSIFVFEASLLGAIFLGAWLGRGLTEGWHFLALVCIAAAGDIFLNVPRVAESFDPGHPLRALRLAFPPAVGGLSPAPALTDILFVSAFMEAASRLKLHSVSILLGVLAGYISAAFLGIEPQPGITMLAMTLVACGAMAAAWPDLKLDSSGVGKAFLAIALTILLLSAASWLHRYLDTPVLPRIMEDRLPNVT